MNHKFYVAGGGAPNVALLQLFKMLMLTLFNTTDSHSTVTLGTFLPISASSSGCMKQLCSAVEDGFCILSNHSVNGRG